MPRKTSSRSTAKSNLRRAFDLYNRRYFGNALEVGKVKWCNQMYDAGEFVPDEIRISSKLRSWNWVWRLTLLHEMAHAATESERAHHGPKWVKLMRSLARRGAFDKLW